MFLFLLLVVVYVLLLLIFVLFFIFFAVVVVVLFDKLSSFVTLQEDANVILVNWEKGADNPKDYIKSATNTRVVGALLAEMMKALHNTAGTSYSSMHLVGHSLGSHVAGYAGARVKPGRITGTVA